jgi:hypothetical protein
VPDLLEKELIALVLATLVEKAMACETHVVSHHALARHELEKTVACEAHAASHHALAWLDKVVACGG